SAGGGVDPLLPEHAEVALARLAVASRPVLGLVHRVLRVTIEFGTTSAIPAGFVDDFLAALPAGGSISGTCHSELKNPGLPGLLFLSANRSLVDDPADLIR